jgi:hypothetical protein
MNVLSKMVDIISGLIQPLWGTYPLVFIPGNFILVVSSWQFLLRQAIITDIMMWDMVARNHKRLQRHISKAFPAIL